MSEIHSTTIEEMQKNMSERKAPAQELIETSIRTIHDKDAKLHAFIEILEESSYQQAKESDQKRKNKSEGPLEGIPIAIKDNICTTEGYTRAASKILNRFSSPYDATVISRLKEAGAIIIGKTNMDEFGMGSSTEFSAYGPTRNPWDTTRVAGGSSGGSAAAVASGQVPVALGTDTGGSIRQPAGYCSVVGMKPTYGRVSRFGAVAYGSSLDQIGPIGKTVKDTAAILEVIAGHDTHDATSSQQRVGEYVAACGQEIDGMRIGVPKEFFEKASDPEMTNIVKEAIDSLQDQGVEVVDISLPLTPAAVAAYYLIAKAEASSNLARYDGLRYGQLELEAATLIERYMEARGNNFGEEVKRSILMGTYALSAGYFDAWYKQASKVRTLITQEYEHAFRNVDVIAAPVSPEVAFPIGEKTDDPLALYMTDAFTVPISIAGLPAMSVPCGFSDNMPVGLQLIAPHFQEETLFKVGHAYEQERQLDSATAGKQNS